VWISDELDTGQTPYRTNSTSDESKLPCTSGIEKTKKKGEKKICSRSSCRTPGHGRRATFRDSLLGPKRSWVFASQERTKLGTRVRGVSVFVFVPVCVFLSVSEGLVHRDSIEKNSGCGWGHDNFFVTAPRATVKVSWVLFD